MPERLAPDLCVIGAGAGGLSVAAAAAGFGVPVVLVEKGRMGGDCLNYGCVPSKALIAAASRAAAAGAPAFGIGAAPPQVDFPAVHAHVHAVIAAIAPNDSRARFTGLGVRVIAGTARFRDRDTVIVGDDFEIRARRFVIATGSSPAVPAIPGLDRVPYLTNETIFDLAACPAHLAIIGAGPVGLELAQAFRRLGAAVTVLEAATPLAREDPEGAHVVLDQIARDGVDIRTGRPVTGVAIAENGTVTIAIGETGDRQTITASHLLVAAGRAPNLADLDLAAAGIAHDRRGVTVTRGLRTTNRRVYAVGDAVGALPFTHVASHHAGLVIRNALFRLPVRFDPDVIPRVTYTDPELAQVGLTEAEATRRGHRINVLRWPYHDNDRAQAERATTGHIKVVTTRRGRILGATIVGANAGDLIATWALAIDRRLDVRAMASLVFPYPTFGEIGKRAALSFFTPCLTNPTVRRIIAWLRLLG